VLFNLNSEVEPVRERPMAWIFGAIILYFEGEIAGQNPTSAKLDFHRENHSKDEG
jgi:hypothetical protein